MQRPEQKLQQACVRYHRYQYPEQFQLLFLNYNNPPSARVGQILKSMGLVAGISDITYLKNGIHFIEFKAQGKYQTKTQKIFEQKVKAEGAEYYVIRDISDFIELMKTINKIN